MNLREDASMKKLWTVSATLAALGLLMSLDAAEMVAGRACDFLRNGVTAHRGNAAEFPENTLAAFFSTERNVAGLRRLDS